MRAAPRRDNAPFQRGEVGTSNGSTVSAQFSPLGSLLSRLDRVRRTGPSTWVASCPTREDKRPSMTIREMDDGRILLHDFGGDSVESILGALGLTFSDLYPPRPADPAYIGKPERRAFPAADILRALSFESLIVALAGRAILDGKHTEADQARLIQAVGRIQAGADDGGLNHG